MLFFLNLEKVKNMNFCSNCGFQLNQDSKFCSKCGEKVEIETTTNVIDKNVENVLKGVNKVKNEISESEYVNKAKETTKSVIGLFWEKTIMIFGYIGLVVLSIQLFNHFLFGNRLYMIQVYEEYGFRDFVSTFLALNFIVIISFVFMFLSGLRRQKLLYVSIIYFVLFIIAFLGNKKSNQPKVVFESTEILNQNNIDSSENINDIPIKINQTNGIKEFKYSNYLTDEIISRSTKDLSTKIKNIKIKSVFEKWISNKITIEEFGILEIYNLYWNNIEKYNHNYNGPGDVFNKDDVSFGFADINNDGIEDCYVVIPFWAAGSASTIWNNYTFIVSNGHKFMIDESFYEKVKERIVEEKENKKVSYFSNIDIVRIDNSGMKINCTGYDEDDPRCCPSINREYLYDFRTKSIRLLN